MATVIRRYEVMEELHELPKLALDEIFKLQWPDRREYLEAFILDEEPIKLKAIDGDTGEFVNWNLVFQDKKFSFGPKGKMVTPRVAIDLIYLYGATGIYRGMDQRTGLTRARLEMLPKSEREDWADKGIHYKDMKDYYLVHYTSEMEEADEAERELMESLKNPEA